MSRLYTVEFTGASVLTTGSHDFFEIAPASNKPVALHAMYMAQSNLVGDANELQLRFRIIRGHTVSGSGGATATPRPVNPNATSASFAAETNNTTIASSGTAVNLHSGSFNTRIGLEIIWVPEDRPRCISGTNIVVRAVAQPTSALTMNGTLYVEELI